MLELRPNCEYCDKDLPAQSTQAYICSYECTFCQDCVEKILKNVCPNCGGGFSPRPIRPNKAYRKGVSLEQQPAVIERKHGVWNTDELAQFIASLKNILPEKR